MKSKFQFSKIHKYDIERDFSAVKTRYRCHERLKTCRMCRKSVASSLQ